MKKIINFSIVEFILIYIVIWFLGAIFGYTFKESQIDDKKDKCYVDGGWNCE